ncbi:MAG: hypothetical protein ABIS03_02815, partial [Gemmatimonadaceae bacterium]
MRKIAILTALLLLGACTRDGSNRSTADTTAANPPVAMPDGPLAEDSPLPDSALNPDCGAAGMAFLTDEGIGALREGRRVSDVKGLCRVISDSPQRGAEGMTERVLVVSIAGEPVRSIVTNDRIGRIEVSSPTFKTADSLGVDTPLSRIAAVKGARFFPGEGGVYGFIPGHCGLSFRFSIPLRPPRGGQWTAKAVKEAHGDAAVDRILVTQC